MLASWSRWVTTISSPGASVRASARLTPKVSVVMFAPKTISAGDAAPSRSAIARCASASMASLRRLVANAPPRLALWLVR